MAITMKTNSVIATSQGLAVALSGDDVAVYHKIVITFTKTIPLIAKIDKLIEKHGGWPGAFTSGVAKV